MQLDRSLTGLRVLDLSRVLAGPWATQNLADLGAEVIKVERPGLGDDTRAWGPPFVKDADGRDTFDSTYFVSANRGKKSVTIDFSNPEGQEIIRALAAECDILVENFRTGTLARYGLDHASLAQVNPRLIYCSITGFGQDGPYAGLPGYDFVLQGMSGLMDMTGNPDDQPGGGPMKVGIAIGDILTGTFATSAILAAVEQRHRTGRGQHIDMSLLDCVVSLTSYQALNYLIGDRMPRRLGNAHPNIVPYQVFRCAEGNLILAIGNQSQYEKFCNAIGRGDLVSDPRFATGAGRIENRDDLIPQLESEMMKRTMLEWIDFLEPHGVPCGPIYRMDQVFEDPQVKHRQMKVSVPHSTGGDIPNVASPYRLSDSPVRYDHAAPTLGQHTDDVLGRVLNYDAAALKALRDRSVL
ncbi:CaiB/BaiF CoA transferase family protein [Pseudooceanicola pacificus]|uniref:CaiB/BaiF CoA transferase family protein n=1 Tax=Pseudooceanicola pacificus TaxID=2676438 RepID=UPI001F4832A1|nr:CaiB/BaiF CoA-transferase family protein [Pseudooceanicola pacificus]